MKKFIVLFVAFSLLVAPSLVWAEASPWAEEETYGNKTKGKLDFGIKNAFGGWTEMFTQPYDDHKEGKNAMVGAGQGFFNAVVDTVGGVIHTGTFFIPVDAPLPNGGVQTDSPLLN